MKLARNIDRFRTKIWFPLAAVLPHRWCSPRTPYRCVERGTPFVAGHAGRSERDDRLHRDVEGGQPVRPGRVLQVVEVQHVFAPGHHGLPVLYLVQYLGQA